MIIWGWKTVFRVIGSGVFSCPTCGADRNYERRKAQRFFTLFFIPLIPLKTIGEFIRCTYCKNDFRESVLARPTASQFTDLLQNTVRGVMVNVLRRGGWEHPGARALAVQEIVTAGAVGYGEPNLAQDMQVVPEDLSQMLAALAGQMPASGREALLSGATRVAAADGPVQPAERAVIDTVGAGLGMSQAHVAGIVASVAPAAAAPAPAAQQQAPTWGTGAQAPVQEQTQPHTPTWGTGAQAPVAPSGAGSETMVIQAPQPAPATGVQDAVPAQAPASSMETMMIQAPQPAPASSGMETVMIPIPQPSQQDTVPEPPPTMPEPPANAMQTMMIPVPQPPQPSIPVPPQTVVDPASSMETMVVPIHQLPTQPPVDPADEPTHVTQSDNPGQAAWPPPHQQ